MKKVLFFMALLFTLSINAQTTVFSENFESVPDYAIPPGWMTSRNPNTTIRPWYVADDYAGMGGTKVCKAPMNSMGDYVNLGTSEISLASGYSYQLKFLLQQDDVAATFSVFVLPAATVFTGSELPVFKEQLNNMSAGVTKTVDLSAFAGQNVKIYFRVEAVENNLALTYLDNVQIIQQTLLGTSEATAKAGLGIYPNPTSDFIYLKKGSDIIKAEVFDQTGRKLNVKVNKDQVDVRSLPAGNYIINVETRTQKYSQKFIKK